MSPSQVNSGLTPKATQNLRRIPSRPAREFQVPATCDKLLHMAVMFSTKRAKMPQRLSPPPLLILVGLICSTVTPTNQASPQASAQLQQQQQKTADLSLLINETLAINKKTGENSSPPKASDVWTFDRVEYDLIEFLQDLSARYKQSNASSGAVDAVDPNSQWLKGKSNQQPAQEKVDTGPKNLGQAPLNSSTQAETESAKPTTSLPERVNKTQRVEEQQAPQAQLQPPLQQQPQPQQHQEQEKKAELTTSAPPPSPLSSSTSPGLPESSATSLAVSLADQEIAESSWQYGIFDRFTRPKSSTTTTTREPQLVGQDSNNPFDVRNFNSDECGLRSYQEELQAQFFPESLENEASKELNQRRQRPAPNIMIGIGSPSSSSAHKNYQFESSPDLDNNGNSSGEEDNQGESSSAYDGQYKFSSSSPKSSQGNSDPSLDSLAPSGDQQSSSPTGGQASDGEFNLASRRHWLQQQLGNTLQLLGFNSSFYGPTTSQSALDFLNQTTGVSLNMRENMMKKSGKIGKSLLDEMKAAAATALPSAISLASELGGRHDDLKLEARVIGGSDARLGDSPWSVSLQALVNKPGTIGVEYRHYCGGTIISEYYVLTAAHCLDFMVGRESRLFVVVGDLNWRMSTASLHGRRFGIEKLIIHSGYKSTAFGHDIGLIKVKESMKPVKANGKYIVNSVCLPERNVEHSGEAELVGWGLFSNRNEMADTLQVADVPILPRPLCVDLYKRRTGLIQWLIGIELITEKQVCAGTFGRGICQGDSGSALVVNEKISTLPRREERQISKFLRASSGREQTRATIIGIVAFGGIRRCSYQSLPGVYMQTSKYLDWILPRIQD